VQAKIFDLRLADRSFFLGCLVTSLPEMFEEQMCSLSAFSTDASAFEYPIVPSKGLGTAASVWNCPWLEFLYYRGNILCRSWGIFFSLLLPDFWEK
jgi:hypothetical protein